MAGLLVCFVSPHLAQYNLAKRHFVWRMLLAVLMLGLSFSSAYGLSLGGSQTFDLGSYHEMGVQDQVQLAVMEKPKPILPWPVIIILSSNSGDLDETITHQWKSIEQNASLTDAEKLLSYINVLEAQDVGYQVLTADKDEVVAGAAAAACRIGAACLLLIAEILDNMS